MTRHHIPILPGSSCLPVPCSGCFRAFEYLHGLGKGTARAFVTHWDMVRAIERCGQFNSMDMYLLNLNITTKGKLAEVRSDFEGVVRRTDIVRENHAVGVGSLVAHGGILR